MTITTIAAELIAAAEATAARIEEEAAEDPEHAYSAAQASYGVEVEVLVPAEDDEDGEWVRLAHLDGDRRPEVLAVRLFDCDGERGRECRTVAEVEADRARWS